MKIKNCYRHQIIIALASHKDMASQLLVYKEIKIETCRSSIVTSTNLFMEAIVLLFGVAEVVPLLLRTKWQKLKWGTPLSRAQQG